MSRRHQTPCIRKASLRQRQKAVFFHVMRRRRRRHLTVARLVISHKRPRCAAFIVTVCVVRCRKTTCGPQCERLTHAVQISASQSSLQLWSHLVDHLNTSARLIYHAKDLKHSTPSLPYIQIYSNMLQIPKRIYISLAFCFLCDTGSSWHSISSLRDIDIADIELKLVAICVRRQFERH